MKSLMSSSDIFPNFETMNPRYIFCETEFVYFFLSTVNVNKQHSILRKKWWKHVVIGSHKIAENQSRFSFSSHGLRLVVLDLDCLLSCSLDNLHMVFIYSVFHNFVAPPEFSGNHGYHKNQVPSMLPH